MTDPVVPPVEHELARIEGSAMLVAAAVADRCRHCAAVPVVIAVHPGSGLARAVEVVHEQDCPLAED